MIILYSGIGTDTTLLTPLQFGDDELPELPGFEGLFEDPRIIFTLPTTGAYTVRVAALGIGPQVAGGFCYQITLNRAPTAQEFNCQLKGTVPEPSSVALAGLTLTGLFGIQAWNRRRQRQV